MKNILHLIRGREGESLAARHLQQHGLKILARNVRIGGGELDLVCQEGATIIFAEVRLRQSGGLVGAAESITPAKQRKWRSAASAYLQKHYPALPDCRFDAICIERGSDGKAQIEWLRGVEI
ncbi:MAG: YraN family protein [Cardiobacteriaceae bacterium]|nr:YraN family protein [Cardiobacteriaceae bacterium]